jgi:hypothetical protein
MGSCRETTEEFIVRSTDVGILKMPLNHWQASRIFAPQRSIFGEIIQDDLEGSTP